ncbi:MAG: undecaprenyl/decaprenyl-phosphate alpha-N-acetylglucosaminyl 1-phosphate transferase [Chloroflexota bacterium]|nr:undecaprenyl/decaprenyl-phosphate alpha-N-acetylglucosaminyl 1-phosphate transferase [Chloroflexota bacterium]
MISAAPGAIPFIIAVMVAATAVSFVLSPFAIRFARQLGAIDRPDSTRRVHRQPVPRGGGLAVVASFVGVGVGALVINEMVRAVPQVRVIPPGQLAALFGGAALAAALGFLDDRYQLRARWQLLSQLVLAGVAVAAGISIGFIDNPFQFLGGPFDFRLIDFGAELAILVTVLWIVGMINSINFIDGLDGLSTGISLIAAVTLGIVALALQLTSVAVLCAVLAGALAGFLPWNFHRARVFIGTTGVYAVGYSLAVLSIMGVGKVAVAMLVLGVPIIDTFWIIIRRLSSRRSPFTPDRGHFHHRLLDLGLTHRGAVLVIYGICGLLAILSLVLSGTGSLYAFMGVVVGGGLVLYLMTRRAREALDARTYEAQEPTDALTVEAAEAEREREARAAGTDPRAHRPEA